MSMPYFIINIIPSQIIVINPQHTKSDEQIGINWNSNKTEIFKKWIQHIIILIPHKAVISTIYVEY